VRSDERRGSRVQLHVSKDTRLAHPLMEREQYKGVPHPARLAPKAYTGRTRRTACNKRPSYGSFLQGATEGKNGLSEGVIKGVGLISHGGDLRKGATSRRRAKPVVLLSKEYFRAIRFASRSSFVCSFDKVSPYSICTKTSATALRRSIRDAEGTIYHFVNRKRTLPLCHVDRAFGPPEA
jgi:hypothetical protein